MSFALVLHAHIPYCRKSGRWPAGEEWLHEAIIESYLPLLKVLEGLEAKGISPNLNIEFTPILLEQLADGYMQDQFIVYLQELIDRATSDIHRFDGRPELQSVARQYQEDFSMYMDYYTGHLKRDVIGAFKHHQDCGNIEIFTSAATHGFLPLFEHESAIWSQVKIGIDTYKKYFGCNPRGFWLPECAFRPMETRNGRQVAGIDYWLKKAGIEYFIVNYTGMEDATLVHANPAGVDYISTYEAYQLAGTGVKVFGRNYETSERVWSAAVGYPGNQVYREFHLKDPVSGLRYFSISKPGLTKEVYDFSRAREKAKIDARDFASIVNQNLSDYRSINKRSGIIVSPYDCELFGHWWHEGPVWMEDVFVNLAEIEEISPITLGTYLDGHIGTFSEVILKETSWGEGGDFRVWQNKNHGWIWPLINGAVREFENVLESVGNPDDERHRHLLRQIARELLLMEGSDWPFLLYTKQATEYANQRFHWHHQRFNTLMWAARDLNDPGRLGNRFLQEVEDIDKCFEIDDLGLFRHRES